MIGSLEILSLFSCIVFSAFFSCSEAVILSFGLDRAKQLIEQGGAKGRAMVFLADRPSELLVTILIGNNIANILAASLSTVIFTRFFQNDAVGISAGIMTVVILIFGEITPKTFGRAHAETLAVFAIRSLQVFYYMLWPLVETTVWLIHTVLGSNAELKGQVVTKQDLEYFINKAEKEKTVDSKQLELLNSIMEFPSIKVKDIMVARPLVKYIRSDWNYEQVISKVKEDNHSRYPVTKGELENTIGFLHVKDIVIVSEAQRRNFDLRKYIKTPFFVYEHMKIQAVFDHMNRKKVHMALVKDENGMVVGVVTLEDIVEQIVGEIIDEHDDELSKSSANAVDWEEGISVDPNISLRDLYNEYDIKIPLNDAYSTLAGFILDMLGNNFPDEGQLIVWEGYTFELIEVDDHQIKKVLIKDVDGEKHLYSKKEATLNRESDEQGSEGEKEDHSKK